MDIKQHDLKAGCEFRMDPDGTVTLTVPAVTDWPVEITVDGLPYQLDGLYEVPVDAVPKTLGRLLAILRGPQARRTECRERYVRS